MNKTVWKQVDFRQVLEFAKTRTAEKHQKPNHDFFESVTFTDGAKVIARQHVSTNEVIFLVGESKDE